MGELIFYTCLIFFSAYGVFSLLFFLTDFFYEKQYLKGKTLCTLLYVKDDICAAENMVKSLLFKDFKNDTGLCDRKIFVVSDTECDATYRALCFAFCEEPQVAVVKPSQLLQKIENL